MDHYSERLDTHRFGQHLIDRPADFGVPDLSFAMLSPDTTDPYECMTIQMPAGEDVDRDTFDKLTRQRCRHLKTSQRHGRAEYLLLSQQVEVTRHGSAWVFRHVQHDAAGFIERSELHVCVAGCYLVLTSDPQPADPPTPPEFGTAHQFHSQNAESRLIPLVNQLSRLESATSPASGFCIDRVLFDPARTRHQEMVATFHYCMRMPDNTKSRLQIETNVAAKPSARRSAHMRKPPAPFDRTLGVSLASRAGFAQDSTGLLLQLEEEARPCLQTKRPRKKK